MTPRKTKKAAPQDGSAPDVTPENLDTVRDILFGGQMRAVEGRLARMEERLGQEQQAIRANLEKALAGVEALARKEIEALHEKLKAERTKRADDLKALTAELKEALKNVDRRIGQLDEATSSADADLRTQVLEHHREAAADLKRLGDTLGAELRRTEQMLRAEKADVSALVAIFSDVAVKLSEELQAPPES